MGIAAAVAAGRHVVLWSRGPSYSMLYANHATEDQAQITQALDSPPSLIGWRPARAPSWCPPNGLSEARLKLAGQGLPDNDNSFSAMTKDPVWVSASSWRTRATSTPWKLSWRTRSRACDRWTAPGCTWQCRANPPSSAISATASASVFVQLKPGRRLEQEQVQAIVNLVASSVPDLHSNQVTVIDQQGHLLTTPPGSDDSSLREERFQVVQRMEDDYEQRIESIVTPIVGIGRVRAQVVAQVDSSTTEQGPAKITSPAARSCAASSNLRPAAAMAPRAVASRVR